MAGSCDSIAVNPRRDGVVELDGAREIGVEARTVVHAAAHMIDLVNRQLASRVHPADVAVEVMVAVPGIPLGPRVSDVDRAGSRDAAPVVVRRTGHDLQRAAGQDDVVGTHRRRVVVHARSRVGFGIELRRAVLERRGGRDRDDGGQGEVRGTRHAHGAVRRQGVDRIRHHVAAVKAEQHVLGERVRDRAAPFLRQDEKRDVPHQVEVGVGCVRRERDGVLRKERVRAARVATEAGGAGKHEATGRIRLVERLGEAHGRAVVDDHRHLAAEIEVVGDGGVGVEHDRAARGGDGLARRRRVGRPRQRLARPEGHVGPRRQRAQHGRADDSRRQPIANKARHTRLHSGPLCLFHARSPHVSIGTSCHPALILYQNLHRLSRFFCRLVSREERC